MAKNQTQKSRSIDERIVWYNGRLNSPYCNEKEKNRAAKRIAALTAQRDRQNADCVRGKSTLPATQGQNNAYNAGIGYGAAKAGVRVPVQPENKPAFRDGVQVGRGLAKK